MSPMKRILVSVDNSPRASVVLAEAVELARRAGAKVRLFRAVGLPPDLPAQITLASSEGLMDSLLVHAKEDIERLAKEVPPDVLDGTFVHVGTPWDAICNAAVEHDVDLIVIGSHGYGGLDRILGTTAAKVVNHADRSVLVVRAKGASAK